MSKVERFTVSIPDLATHEEFIIWECEETNNLGEFTLEKRGYEILIAVLSSPNGLFPKCLEDTKFQLTNKHGYNPTDKPNSVYVSHNLLIIDDTEEIYDGLWTVTSSSGEEPFLPHAVTVMAFHRPDFSQLLFTARGVSACRICKTTAKGVALAIIAAASMQTLPLQLINAVAIFLGITTVAATTFIMAVIGDTVDVIVEKLCQKIGLCP